MSNQYEQQVLGQFIITLSRQKYESLLRAATSKPAMSEPTPITRAAASCLDLSDLLDVVREMAEAANGLRVYGAVTSKEMEQALLRARPYLGGE